MAKEAQLRARQGLPPLVASMPEPEQIHDDLIDLWQCWWQMNARRQAGVALSGLPLSEVAAELDERGLRGPLRARWRRLIDAMELAYLEHAREVADGSS